MVERGAGCAKPSTELFRSKYFPGVLVEASVLAIPGLNQSPRQGRVMSASAGCGHSVAEARCQKCQKATSGRASRCVTVWRIRGYARAMCTTSWPSGGCRVICPLPVVSSRRQPRRRSRPRGLPSRRSERVTGTGACLSPAPPARRRPRGRAAAPPRRRARFDRRAL